MSENETVRKMLTCVYCNQVPRHPPIYTCKKGHTSCEYCFLELRHGERKQSICPVCGNKVDTRNLIGEELLKYFHVLPTGNVTNKSPSRNSLKHSKYSTHGGPTLGGPHKSVSYTSISKRPIYCPISDCRKMIAVTQLISHFSFEHTKIHQEHVDYNQAKCLALSLNSMEYGKSHCLALLLVSEDSPFQTPMNNGIAFPLLAARLLYHPEKTPPTDGSSLEESSTSVTSSADQLEFNQSDMVMVWLCSNLDLNISCSLEVSDDKKSRVLSYFGPVNSLRHDNNPDAVFARADCLSVHSTNIRKITQNGQYPMDMKIVLSCPVE